MTTLIFGIGVGLFLILLLWVLAALIFIISLRIEKKIGAIAILTVSICTLILIALPRASGKQSVPENKVYDHLFIWRILLLILLTVSSIMGIAGYINFGLTESVKPVRINNWVF